MLTITSLLEFQKSPLSLKLSAKFEEGMELKFLLLNLKVAWVFETIAMPFARFEQLALLNNNPRKT